MNLDLRNSRAGSKCDLSHFCNWQQKSTSRTDLLMCKYPATVSYFGYQQNHLCMRYHSGPFFPSTIKSLCARYVNQHAPSGIEGMLLLKHLRSTRTSILRQFHFVARSANNSLIGSVLDQLPTSAIYIIGIQYS